MKNILKCFLFMLIISCQQSKPLSNQTYKSKIDSLLSIMTIEEKAGQLTLYTSGWAITGPQLRDDYKTELLAGRAGNLFNAHTVSYAKELQRMAVEETRLGIPLLFGMDIIHGYKTIYPIPLAESCTWDLALIEKSARLSATEATAAGVNWTFNPMVDIARDPRWGRIAEGSGEDTYLGSLIGAAKVRGYQGKDLSSPETMLACVKHFAAYGASQAGRDYHTVDISDRVLRDTYLPPFKAAIDAGAATIMTSFNEVDGIPSSGNKYLLMQILRDEWGFEGFVVTDYTSINEMVPHGIVANEKEAAKLAFEAGVAMDMQGGVYSKYIPELIKEGKISEAALDKYVAKVLEMKYKLGLFDNPYLYLDEEREEKTLFNEEMMQHSLYAARESIVLLKNKEKILPLSKELKQVGIIGALATSQRDMLGTWHVAGDPEKAITLIEGFKNVVPNTKIDYAPGYSFDESSDELVKEALIVAKKSDIIILALGENFEQSGEAASRSVLDLPGTQQQLLEAVKALGKPVIVVLMAGRPLCIDWMDKNANAILNTWHLGTMAGQAIAETLFGDNNPSGKLTSTFPLNEGQIPIYYNMKNTGRPFNKDNKYTSKYIDVANEPLYPFGYGLSYSNFSYSDLQLSSDKMKKNEVIDISVRVANKGIYEGEEVVQLYIQDIVGSVTRPVMELKGFKKILLTPGEDKLINFTIRISDLVFYSRNNKWEAESGEFQVMVGTNSREYLESRFLLDLN